MSGGIGFDLPLHIYEADTFFFKNYFDAYRVDPSVARTGGEVAVPQDPSEVVTAPILNSEQSLVPETEVAAPEAATQTTQELRQKEGIDFLKYATLILIAADKLL